MPLRMLLAHHRTVAGATRPLSVLLAEDHAEFRELVARALEADGALVDCVADGESAHARLFEGRFRPDVVVSDVRMAGKTSSGFAAAEDE